MLKPIYIYKFKAYKFFEPLEPISYTRYFILDSHNINDSDHVDYLTQLYNYDQIFINSKANKYYPISRDFIHTLCISNWRTSTDFFSPINFEELIQLLDNIVRENIDSGWQAAAKLVELLQLVIAKWDEWN